MYSQNTVTERGYSSLADNILMLRYAQLPGELRPTLSVVKTRGSAHDRNTYFFSIGKGGIHLEEQATEGSAAANEALRVREDSEK